MIFLRTTDYNRTIQSDSLNQIIDNNSTILDDCELVAISELTSYLTQRYDTKKVFSQTSSFDPLVTYDKDQRVFSGVTSASTIYYYSVVTGNTGNNLSDTNFFLSGDNRNQQIISYTLDILLYHLHSRINPRQIPDLRQDRYDNAISWLKMVAKGDITADLPKVDSANQVGFPIRWGSPYSKNNNFY